MYYQDLPKELYIIGSIVNGILDMESENDLDGNQWLCIWADRKDCLNFKKLYCYKYPVSKINRLYLSSTIYNANIDNKIPVNISYVYLNPSEENISHDRKIINVIDDNVIDVLNYYTYIIDVYNDLIKTTDVLSDSAKRLLSISKNYLKNVNKTKDKQYKNIDVTNELNQLNLLLDELKSIKYK